MYKKCPLCNEDLHQDTWNDEKGVVEFIYQCYNVNCIQYKHHWYYGVSKVTVGDLTLEFSDHDYLEEKYKLIAKDNWNNINKKIKEYKFDWRKYG